MVCVPFTLRVLEPYERTLVRYGPVLALPAEHLPSRRLANGRSDCEFSQSFDPSEDLALSLVCGGARHTIEEIDRTRSIPGLSPLSGHARVIEQPTTVRLL